MPGEEGHTRGAEEIEKLEKLKKQVAELEQQQKLAESQTALADALKNQLSAQYNLESEKARQPFAELAGIKAGGSGLQLPVGKEGTISIASGAAGTALLRSKKQMIRLLDTIADELRKLLPDGAVIVMESQLDQAYQAEFMEKTIKDQIDKLTTARKQLKPEQPEKIYKMALGQVICTAHVNSRRRFQAILILRTTDLLTPARYHEYNTLADIGCPVCSPFQVMANPNEACCPVN
jgi:uncharacterized phage infection (PIP) family protein YhgE